MKWIFCLFAIYCALDFHFVDSVLVNTPLGSILGTVKQYGARNVLQFLNVPYAEPPVGLLRFQKPVPVRPWIGILNATAYGPACVQSQLPIHQMSENCLKLNIYIPNSINIRSPRAVMVYIHGGGYINGQGKSQDGALLALTGDVIVITINYRLDVFGFLGTEYLELPGNYGLWDQRQSFLWVRNYIAAFGGNPNLVTIFGESAGAYSVGLHLVSNRNTGLFNRAICESGTTLSPRALAFDPIGFSRRFLIQIGCFPSGNVRNVSICLISKPAVDILLASNIAKQEHFLAFRLEIGPVVDGDFLQKQPFQLLTAPDIPLPNVDLMAGTNSAEGILILGPLSGYQNQLQMDLRQGIPTRVLCFNISTAISRDYYLNSPLVANEICQTYSSAGLPDDQQARQVVDMYGDMSFLAPTVAILDVHTQLSKGRSSYQYYFTHEAVSSTIRVNYPWFVGVPHAGELPFVFGPAISFPPGTTYTQAEVEFSNKLQIYWTNFAKRGNPNGLHIQSWTRYSTAKSFINLDLVMSPGNHIFPDRMKLWLSKNPVAFPIVG
ncbi:hypothetical protein SNE40_018615 [Patella caerulea]|uniref:Carboxylic ester hydrolase n=1 Tax=Patella caerulea TaxID=87958 RepID=A0AAN8J5B8_PATCE